MYFPLHAGHGGGVDPVAVFVGALTGVGVWLAIRWVSVRQGTRR